MQNYVQNSRGKSHTSTSAKIKTNLESEFWSWFTNQYSKYVHSDYTQVCLKVIHGIPSVNTLRPKGEDESEMSAQNRLRNVPRAYKRDLRFKLIDLYAKPFNVPWTQTFATHMLRLVFNTTASATYVNKAFASSNRTSKERIDFRPVLNSIGQDDLDLLRSLYDQASQTIDEDLLVQAKISAEQKARSLRSKQEDTMPPPAPSSITKNPLIKTRTKTEFQTNQYSLF